MITLSIGGGRMTRNAQGGFQELDMKAKLSELYVRCEEMGYKLRIIIGGQ